MPRDTRLLFGPLAALIFAIGIFVLAQFVPGYSSMRQTVSEIGEMVSPMRWPFFVMLSMVAGCLLVFASGVQRIARDTGRGMLITICIAWMAVAAVGTGLFAFPHVLHNVFGISELIAYQAPLVFVLAWRRDPRMRGAVWFSGTMYVLTLLSLAVNLMILSRSGALWEAVEPVNGLVQRSLFATFFLWTAGLGWMLFSRSRHAWPATGAK